jgi:cell division protein FtsL
MADLAVLRRYSLLAFSVALATLSALGVVYSVHSSRQLVTELQQLRHEQEQLQVQWGQLLLEKSTLGSYARVEVTARDRLGMYLPPVNEIVVVAP